MTHEITIPPQALEKAAMAAWECKREAHSGLMPAWLDVLPMVRQQTIEEVRAACLALLEAWPNMSRIDRVTQNDSPVPGFSEPFIILPLQQKEPAND